MINLKKGLSKFEDNRKFINAIESESCGKFVTVKVKK